MTWPSAMRFRYYFTFHIIVIIILAIYYTWFYYVHSTGTGTGSRVLEKTIATIHRRLVLTNLTSKIIGSPLCTSTCRRCPNSGGCGSNPLGLD